MAGEVSPLAQAMRRYLERNPQHWGEAPSWIGLTLWAYDLYPGKPTPEESKAAMRELDVASLSRGAR